MDQPSTTPAGSGSAAPRPGTEHRERNQSTDSAPPLPRPGVDAGGDAQRLVKQGAAEIGREARDVKDSVKQAATDAAGKARDAAAQGAQQAKQQAGQLAAQLRDKGASLLDQQKGR